MAKGKKFEQDGGYSAIGRVFVRDAAIPQAPVPPRRAPGRGPGEAQSGCGTEAIGRRRRGCG